MTDSHPQAARWAVFSTFIFAGIIVGAWVPQVPLAEARLGVSHGAFGFALLAIALGAVIAMPITGALINVYGSAKVTLIAGLFYALSLMAPVFAPNYPLFVAGAFAMGAGMGAQDVGMNAHGIAAEKALGRPIMSGLHAGWSLGCVAGGFACSWLISHFSPALEVMTAALVAFVALALIYPFYLPASADKGFAGSHFGWPTQGTWALGALCFLALMIEGSVADWAGILTKERFALDPGQLAFGFAFYQGGMTASRLAGDWARARFGTSTLVISSAVLAALGMGCALIAPTSTLTFIAYVIGGVGVGNLAPVLYAGGGKLEPDAPGRGIAAVVSMGYAGFLCGPPIIGFVAQATSLQISLGLTVLACLVIALTAKRVTPA